MPAKDITKNIIASSVRTSKLWSFHSGSRGQNKAAQAVMHTTQVQREKRQHLRLRHLLFGTGSTLSLRSPGFLGDSKSQSTTIPSMGLLPWSISGSLHPGTVPVISPDDLYSGRLGGEGIVSWSCAIPECSLCYASGCSFYCMLLQAIFSSRIEPICRAFCSNQVKSGTFALVTPPCFHALAITSCMPLYTQLTHIVV